MKLNSLALLGITSLMAAISGCASDSSHVDVVDLNKVLDALVAVLDESGAPATAPDAGAANLSATDGKAEISSLAEIQAVEPAKQDPQKETDFLTRYAAKLNEMKVMSSPVGVSMSPGGEIIGFVDPNQNNQQDLGEDKEFTVTIDPANKRLVASDNHGYHRPHVYHSHGGGMMMGYMLGSMMGRQNSYYSGPMAAAKPGFANTPMSDSNYHKSAVSSVRSKVSSAASSARMRTGSKGFSFGK
jgi:hypothetical protein